MKLEMPQKIKPAQLVLIALIFLIFIAVFLFGKDQGPWADENTHISQIQKFYNHDYQIIPWLTNIPGYHLIMASFAKLLYSSSMQVIRGFNLGFGLLTLLVFWLLLKIYQPQASVLRFLQFAFFPIVFPYHFLVYTDILSLLLVLTSLYLGLKRRYELSGLICTISILIRQNNAVWLVMIPLMTYLVQEPFTWNWDAAFRLLKRCWVFGLGLIGSCIFFYLNGGVALGDKGNHPPGGLYTGNIFFMLFLSCMFFLPSMLTHFPRIVKAVKQNRYVSFSCLILFGLYLGTFHNSHGYNVLMPEYFLRNGILVYFTSTEALRKLFFIPIVFAALDLLTSPLIRKEGYLIYLFTALYLMPSWLIEQRYTMIPFALLLLFRPEEEAEVELATCLVCIFLAAFFSCGISLGKFFL